MKRLFTVLVVLSLALFGIVSTAFAQEAEPTEIELPTFELQPEEPIGNIQVHFIDVGQGESILIVSPEGNAALIDGGSAGTGVLQYLQKQGIKRLDYVVATIAREDHISGLPEVFKGMPVGTAITSGQAMPTGAWNRLNEAIDASGAEYVEVKKGDTIQVGSATLEVLNPLSSERGRNLNDGAIVLRLVWGNVGFMLTSDVEEEAQATMLLSSSTQVSATILKLGLHGSRTASSEGWLKMVDPEVAIYSAGVRNSYHYPHTEVTDALAAAGVTLYGTDVNGTIVVTSDGTGYTIATSK